jgi:hypothetical protein
MVDWPLFVVECFVALGTLGLAWFTMRLARSTKLDVEAQWRPLLVPCELETPETGIPTKIGWADLGNLDVFTFAFKNTGKGAALDIGGEMGSVNFIDIEPISNPVLGVDEHAEFHGGPIRDLHLANNRIGVNVSYSDLAGNRHETFAVYRRTDDDAPWRVIEVTPQPPEYPHPGTMWRRHAVQRLRHPFRAVKRWWLRNPLY